MNGRAGRLLLLFFAALHALVLFGLFRRSEGRIAAGVVLASAIPLTLAGRYLLQRIVRPLSWLDLWVLAYAAWSLASGLLFLQPDNPSFAGAYPYGLYHFVLPIACYFAGKALPRESRQPVLEGLLLINAFVMALGLYLHFARPAVYVDFLAQRLASQGAVEEWQYFARMQSYLGSTTVGYLGATSLVLATIAGKRAQRLLPLLVPLFVVGAALSMQRASLIGLVLALLYLAVLARTSAALRLLLVASTVGGVVYATIRAQEVLGPLADALQERATQGMIEGFTGFFADRGYAPGLRYLHDFPLGVGLGATSSAAAQVGLATRGEVADANFMRIAADLGPTGLLLILLVLAAAAGVAYRGRNRAAWLTFLAIHVGIMLSTNVFDSFYISQSFWLLLAFLDRDRGEELDPTIAWTRGSPAIAGAAPVTIHPTPS